ncbi:MAG TPA: helical backbone metal receptor [Vicinamibacterales bacterium]|nr:helical backbone metal receptor [Vicinamibacterales bacterium]
MAARQKELIAAVCAVALLSAASLVRLAWANPAGFAPQIQNNPARRIVSLVPNITEMLFAIGAGSQVVGVSSYDDFPPETKALPRVGALLDPDTERIFALRPDLVIVYGSQTELESQFARAGIRVYAYRHAGIGNVLQTIRDIARLVGRSADGDRAVRDLQAQLDTVRARVRGRPRPRTMLVIGRDTGALRGVYVSGGVGFLHELLDIAGGDDLFADIKRESVQPSNETMIVRAPDVIVELWPGSQPPAETLQRERAVWNLLASVPAVRNNRIHLLYGDYLLAAGPRLGRAADTLARAVHPDAFPVADLKGRSR